MFVEGITIAAENRRYVQNTCVIQTLLDTCSNRMSVVFSLNNSNRDVGLVVQDVVRSLSFTTDRKIDLYVDAAIREANFLTNLLLHVPSGLLKCRAAELGAD